MHRWNRPERCALAVLLLSIFTPWSSAAEPATLRSRSELRPAPADRSAAAQRWSELKSRYQPNDVAEWRPTSQAESRRAAPVIRPIPDEEPEEIDEDEWYAKEATNLETEYEPEVRPATIRARNDEPLQISDFEDETPVRIPRQSTRIAVEELVDDPESLREADQFLAPEAEEPPPSDAPLPEENAPEPAPSLEGVKPEDPGYSPEVGERRLRQMNEISPHYDVTIDQDIREYAKQQAKRYNVEFRQGAFPQRNFPGFVYQWEPSNFYHYPLYFEDVPLERYGHTYHPVIQPVVSIAKFSSQLVFLPYQMTLDPICTPKYALGYYRPGECAPKLHYQPPLNAAAAAVEAGVITGLFYAIP